jgi:alanyl-tRNA synthetase
VLHICTPGQEGGTFAGLTVAQSANAKVDYTRRRKVAPNHTMTHVLNYALRKVNVR